LAIGKVVKENAFLINSKTTVDKGVYILVQVTLFKHLFSFLKVAQRGEEWLSFAQFNLEIIVPALERTKKNLPEK
jgi:hypothetical protein